MSKDTNLVQRAQSGDSNAAGAIYDRYVPLVRAIVRDATTRQRDADDVVQDVFVRVFASLHQLRRPDRLGGWIVQIARRQSVEFRREAAKRGAINSLDVEPAASRSGLEQDECDAVRDAVSNLPERERLAVHMFYLCDRPANVARKSLGLSTSGFYKLLERARERLRVELAERVSR